MSLQRSLFILSLNFLFVFSFELNERIDLNSNWTLINSNLNITIQNVTLPASVHTILRDHDLIPNPLEGYNDINLRWIAKESGWIFQNQFIIRKNLSGLKFNLHLESIDTMAYVYLNDKQILSTNNQFIEYKINDLVLTNEQNLLGIQFNSAIDQSEQAASVYSYRVPPECPPDVQKGECHVNFLRKQQCSFSWDWGPAFAPIGINGRVYFDLIRSFDFSYSLSVYPSQDITDWVVDIDLDIEISDDLKTNTEAKITFKIEELNYEYQEQLNLNERSQNFKLDISSKKYQVKLWWPLGYGEQKLYNLSIQIDVDNSIMISRQKQIGFRKVELIQNPVQPEGLTFYFEINSVPIFLKGSNWIPADSFQELVTEDYLKWLLGSAQRANMNVLRVWGGGVYEQESFYDLADTMGILIWQDFMFACATYPTNSEFLENVKKEVEYQVCLFSLKKVTLIILIELQ
jgi:beta-mannosidase